MPSKSTSTDSTPDTLSVLSILFDRIDPQNLKYYLIRAAANGLTENDRQKLLAALKTWGLRKQIEQATQLAAAPQTEHHCVRCHAEYTDRENYEGQCIIEHEFPNGHDNGEWDGPDRYRYTCKACGESAVSENADFHEWGFEPCYKGLHTSDPDDVEYDDENTFTCEHNKCDEKRREASSECDEEESEASC